MTSDHLISLLKVNFNNIDDLKKIQNVIDCMIEAIEIEQMENFMKSPQKQPATLKQLMHQANFEAANGTSLKGYVTTTYNKLVEAFGLPQLNNGPSQFDKVSIEWVLRFSDGTIVTIYDWKGYGWQPAPNEEYEWHIGGHHASAVALVKDELGFFHPACRN